MMRLIKAKKADDYKLELSLEDALMMMQSLQTAICMGFQELPRMTVGDTMTMLTGPRRIQIDINNRVRKPGTLDIQIKHVRTP